MTTLDPKDILTISVSSLSLIVALTSFVLMYRQRAIEDKRGIRQSLTDTLSSMADITLAMAKLEIDNPKPGPEIVSMRRNYNSSRRYLANHVEFLISRIPELATDIDYQMLATAFDAIGDYPRAEEHWQKCVECSPSAGLRAMNLRGFARFLFGQGNFDRGRQKYEESLRIDLPDNDQGRRIRADTLAMWSGAERENGFTQEAERRRQQAVQEAARIGHKRIQLDMLKYIEDLSQ